MEVRCVSQSDYPYIARGRKNASLCDNDVKIKVNQAHKRLIQSEHAKFQGAA